MKLAENFYICSENLPVVSFVVLPVVDNEVLEMLCVLVTVVVVVIISVVLE